MSHSRSGSDSSSSGKHHVSLREQVGGEQVSGGQSSSEQGSGEQAHHGQLFDEHASGEYEGLYERATHQQVFHEQARHGQTHHESSTGENMSSPQVRHGDERASIFEGHMANGGVARYGGGSSSSILDDAESYEGEEARTFIRRSVGPEEALADEQAPYASSEEDPPSDGDELNEEEAEISDRDQEDEIEEEDNGLGLYGDEDHADDYAMGHEQGGQEGYDEDDAAMGLDQSDQDDYDEDDGLMGNETAIEQDYDEDDAMAQQQGDQDFDEDDIAMHDVQDDYDQNDYQNEDIIDHDDYEEDDMEDEGATVPDHTLDDASEDDFGEDKASQQGLDNDENDSDSNNDRISAPASDSEYDSDNIVVRHPGRFTMLPDAPSSSHFSPHSRKHKRPRHHHHTASESDEESSLHSDSSLSSLGSTPPPPNPELLAISKAKALAKWPLCKCAGWCSCERYVIFVGDGEEALKCADPAERDDLCFPSQTHLPEHVLAGEQFPLSAMRTTTNPVDLGGSVHAFSWDSLPRPRRAPVGWVGGEWRVEIADETPAAEDASGVE